MRAYASARAHLPKVPVACLETADLSLYLFARQPVGRSNRSGQADAVTCNGLKLKLSERTPIGAHFAPEVPPLGSRKFPVHFKRLLAGGGSVGAPAHTRMAIVPSPARAASGRKQALAETNMTARRWLCLAMGVNEAPACKGFSRP
jgi:hypothetical protein